MEGGVESQPTVVVERGGPKVETGGNESKNRKGTLQKVGTGFGDRINQNGWPLAKGSRRLNAALKIDHLTQIKRISQSQRGAMKQ